ncbi:type II toxin-antitoxin system RelE/ParE family toxin [Flavobacterium sp.]|uniref:type II toxin-antitoxin system RelE/ParE family toxin n=1 Tax=Flavobacterium sp. TaxID=239 RepID=UPI001208A0DE|nr:type II toxin-antitoxin system RelE/ParE family toxin [Flavobacterium sp.]RZJ73534.1 MAG: type II toxin-antitoxin system RelE/ParE family toxin [Flavobacterium sp.]
MELTVYWLEFAQDRITAIFDYYKSNVGVQVAENIVAGIVDASFEIGKNPFGGQRENALVDRIREYRYSIYKSYKIIYWIDEPNKMVFISTVFDSRRNPKELDF